MHFTHELTELYFFLHQRIHQLRHVTEVNVVWKPEIRTDAHLDYVENADASETYAVFG